ncbi:MAG: hypothetical protein AAF939_06425 [Planctomycetota bacterium]
MHLSLEQIFLLADRLQQVKSISLVLGFGALCGGILLLMNHKRQIDDVIASGESDRVIAFEQRKYRRRSWASTMISCLGCFLGGLYWVNDQKLFTIFILAILGLLLGIFGLAIIDLFIVGIHHIATPDQKAQKEMIAEYLRQREKLINQTESEDPSDSSSASD